MAYPVETWAKVRADYESGNFSVRELSEKYQIFYKTIDDKIASDGWIKGKYRVSQVFKGMFPTMPKNDICK